MNLIFANNIFLKISFSEDVLKKAKQKNKQINKRKNNNIITTCFTVVSRISRFTVTAITSLKIHTSSSVLARVGHAPVNNCSKIQYNNTYSKSNFLSSRNSFETEKKEMINVLTFAIKCRFSCNFLKPNVYFYIPRCGVGGGGAFCPFPTPLSHNLQERVG